MKLLSILLLSLMTLSQIHADVTGVTSLNLTSAVSTTTSSVSTIAGLWGGINAANSAIPSATLSYAGGPVLQNVQVTLIFWSTYGFASSEISTLISFYQYLPTSSYLTWLSQYSGIGAGSYKGAYAFTTANVGTGYITDAQIRSVLSSFFASTSTPAPNANSLYMIYFPPGVTIVDASGATSCSSFCAYHGAYYESKYASYIPYGVMPYVSGCVSGCTRGLGGIMNALTMSGSHELLEAVTNPLVNIRNAWADYTLRVEIADICAAFYGKLSSYYVAMGWSNSARSCTDGSHTVATCAYSSCTSCITNPSCGWCKTTATCTGGDANGPYDVARCPVASFARTTTACAGFFLFLLYLTSNIVSHNQNYQKHSTKRRRIS